MAAGASRATASRMPENSRMQRRSVLSRLATSALLLSSGVWAQTPPAAPQLQPMNASTIAAALTRALGADVPALKTIGELELHGKQFYIAEYQVLVEVSGEYELAPVDGMAFGVPVWGERLRVQYSTRHDVASIQTLVDRAWADLQKRLADSDVNPAPAQAVIAEHGALFDADQAATTEAAPVLVESRSGTHLRRYMVFAPSGMKIVPRSFTGIAMGNLVARMAWPLKNVEAVSLAVAIDLTGLDLPPGRESSFALPSGTPPKLKPVSPLLELRPAPGHPLARTHAVAAQVELTDAVSLAGEFGRLRPAPAGHQPEAPNPLTKLLSLGERLATSKSETPVTPTPALLELDGPATARLISFGLAAANEAITIALERAVTPFSERR